MSTVGQATHMRCPKAPGPVGGDNTTHHLLPRAAGMTCAYCGRTESQIKADAEEHRALIERMHAATTIDSAGGAS